MNCKDCVHFGVCRFSFDVEEPVDIYGFHYLGNNDVYDKAEVSCSDFKDKSRFVELPCKVGDNIYWIDCIGNIIEEKVKSFTVGIENENGSFPIGHFGSSLFTTKEEAEKKLGEMKK